MKKNLRKKLFIQDTISAIVYYNVYMLKKTIKTVKLMKKENRLSCSSRGSCLGVLSILSSSSALLVVF